MTFSIIIPVYNVAPYLRECLDSVFAQTYSDWEAICVDDGSTDGSGAILDEYAAKDARFRVIHQRNAGVSAARNVALDVAKGDWVAFVDADDVLLSDALSRILKIIDSHPNEDLIRFGYENFADGEDFRNVEERCVRREYAGDRVVDISRQIAYEDYFVYVWQFVFRRTMIAGMKFERYIRGEDRVFVIQTLCSKANSFVTSDDVCYLYRKRQGSAMTAKASVQVMKDELSHRLDVIEAIDKSGKVMPYQNVNWLERYCLRRYLAIVEDEGGYSSEEQRELITWFYHELPRIGRAKGYSVRGKIYAQLYRICCGAIGRYFVRCCLPLWLHRVKVLITLFKVY